MSKTLELAKELMRRRSITPNDEGCQTILIDRLKKIGFEITSLPFGDVSNFWARRGSESPLFVFAGHTDVVPPGPLEAWKSDPFTPTIENGNLYGRGAADMKGSIAAMVTACESFLQDNPDHKGSIAFLITGDEEGNAQNGTKKVVEHLKSKDVAIDYCLIGEASCDHQCGDSIKIGRRGSLTGILTIHGKQGHIAYTTLTDNPIITIAPALVELSNTTWDEGNEHFPPTTFQVSNINAGTGVENMTPGSLKAVFNFRYSTQHTAKQLKDRVIAILDKHPLVYEIDWRNSGGPYITREGKLVDTLTKTIESRMGLTPRLSTTGGISDGRFLTNLSDQLVEFGPCNGSIHQANEHTKTADLETLTRIYEETLKQLLGQG